MIESMKRRYVALVDFLGATLGPNYEIVLQEIGDDNNGIIAIANGQISGRKVGNPLTSIALRFIMQKKYEYTDSVLNYVGVLENGKIVRSSSYFIKDSGKLVGMLCINFDSSKFQELSDQLLAELHPNEFLTNNSLLSNKGFVTPKADSSFETPMEYFQADTRSLMDEIMNNVIVNMSQPIEELSPSGRAALVAELYDHGLFQLKDSINYVAERFGCSPVSVYRYLAKVRGAAKD